jgi:NMD protein affecting ribosome stability and mRNA decay
MPEVFRKQYNVKLPKSRHEVEEFKGKKAIILCEKCGIAYYKKSWHHHLEGFKSLEKKPEKKLVKFILCPACKIIKNKQYEGLITIKNIPAKFNQELDRFIEGYGRRAYERDPLDRVIGIKKSGSTWEVTTTENELAEKLACKIQETFCKLKPKVSFSPEPSDAVYIKIDFSRK